MTQRADSERAAEAATGATTETWGASLTRRASELRYRPFPRITHLGAFAIFVAAVGGATALRLALDPYISGFPYIFYFPALVIVAVLTGARWGFAALVACALLAWYIFIPPRLSFTIGNPADAFGVAIFFVSGSVVLAFPLLLRRSLERLQTSEQRYRQLAGIAAGLTWVTNAAGEIDEPQEGFTNLTGMAWPSYRGRGWLEAIHPDDAKAAPDGAAAPILAAQLRIKTEAAGDYHWFALRSEKIDFGEAGALMHTAVDVNDLKMTQERQEMLNGELRHRLKNLMAVIGGIANQSRLQGGPAIDVDQFLGRIYAILRTGEAVLATASRQPPISEVAQLALAPFIDNQKPGLIRIDGPAIMVKEQTAGTLALALHELATNSLKYGALSVADGKVDLVWSRQGERDLSIAWMESGGPPAQPPSHEGFGMRVIRMAVGREKNPRVEVKFDGEGFSCRMTYQLDTPVPPTAAYERLESIS